MLVLAGLQNCLALRIITQDTKRRGARELVFGKVPPVGYISAALAHLWTPGLGAGAVQRATYAKRQATALELLH